jgi:hypothetical protein
MLLVFQVIPCIQQMRQLGQYTKPIYNTLAVLSQLSVPVPP